MLEKCMACPSSVKTGDVMFATRFVAAYLFVKVKSCCPMTSAPESLAGAQGKFF